MFGIGGGELIFIILIVLMLFGADKIPEIARGFGKGMAQLKNASNEVKYEIQRSAKNNGLDIDELTGGLKSNIEGIKKDVLSGINPQENVITDYKKTVEEIKEDIENATGPIKRQL